MSPWEIFKVFFSCTSLCSCLKRDLSPYTAQHQGAALPNSTASHTAWAEFGPSVPLHVLSRPSGSKTDRNLIKQRAFPRERVKPDAKAPCRSPAVHHQKSLLAQQAKAATLYSATTSCILGESPLLPSHQWDLMVLARPATLPGPVLLPRPWKALQYEPEASMLPAAHVFSLLCTRGCSSFPVTCYQITTLIVYTTHGISWAVWQCPYSQVTSRMRKPQVCEQIWEVLRKDKQFVTTTLSRSLSFSLSMALFSPSSSRSIRRTVSPERVLNFFLKQHSQNDHLPKRQNTPTKLGNLG